MIELKTARTIAATYLREGVRNSCRWTASIQDRLTREHDFGWVFFYQTPEFIATGDVRTSLISNAPLIVDRREGWISWTGTAYDISVYEAAYRRYRLGRERRSPHEGVDHSSWFKRTNAARARKFAEEFLGAGVRGPEGITPVITPDPQRGGSRTPRNEYPFGWIFEWDSKEYLKTRDPKFLLCGQGDMVVLRGSGAVFETGNLYRPSEYLERLLTHRRLRPRAGEIFSPMPSVGLTRNISPYLSIKLSMGGDFVPAASVDEVRALFERGVQGSKGIVLGHRTGAVGHTFNFVREGSGVDMIDFQIGRRAWLEKPFERVWYLITDGPHDGREPLGLESARAIAQDYLDVMPKDDGVELTASRELPTDSGWVFTYQSRTPMNQENLAAALLNGGDPVAVDRISHQVTGVGREMEEWADRQAQEMGVGVGTSDPQAPPRMPGTEPTAPATGGESMVPARDGKSVPRDKMPREIRLAFAACDELKRQGILPPPEQDIYANTTGVYSTIAVDAALGAIDANEGLPDEDLVRIAAAAAADELAKFRSGGGKYRPAFDQLMRRDRS